MHRSGTHQRIKALLGKESAQLVSEDRLDFLLLELVFKLNQELVDDPHDHVRIERAEGDDCIKPIAELWRKHALDVDHLVTGLLGVREPNRALLQGLRTGVRRHDHDHVAEIRLATIVVRERTVVHDL